MTQDLQIHQPQYWGHESVRLHPIYKPSSPSAELGVVCRSLLTWNGKQETEILMWTTPTTEARYPQDIILQYIPSTKTPPQWGAILGPKKECLYNSYPLSPSIQGPFSSRAPFCTWDRARQKSKSALRFYLPEAILNWHKVQSMVKQAAKMFDHANWPMKSACPRGKSTSPWLSDTVPVEPFRGCVNRDSAKRNRVFNCHAKG